MFSQRARAIEKILKKVRVLIYFLHKINTRSADNFLFCPFPSVRLPLFLLLVLATFFLSFITFLLSAKRAFMAFFWFFRRRVLFFPPKGSTSPKDLPPSRSMKCEGNPGYWKKKVSFIYFINKRKEKHIK